MGLELGSFLEDSDLRDLEVDAEFEPFLSDFPPPKGALPLFCLDLLPEAAVTLLTRVLVSSPGALLVSAGTADALDALETLLVAPLLLLDGCLRASPAEKEEDGDFFFDLLDLDLLEL